MPHTQQAVHTLQARCRQPPAPLDAYQVLSVQCKPLTSFFNQGCGDDLLAWSHHSKVHHSEVVARQHNSNNVLSNVVDVSLHRCQDDGPQVPVLRQNRTGGDGYIGHRYLDEVEVLCTCTKHK